MKQFTKDKSWVIFLITVLPFLLAMTKPYGHYLLIIGFFLTTYWIISAGKYGAEVTNQELTKTYTVFIISNRLIFILFASSYLLMNYLQNKSYNKTIFIISIASMILFSAALLFTIVYSSIMLEEAEKEQVGVNKIIVNCILFLLFPIGVWILQPRINKHIGEAID